jgi:hypothetical protein
MDVNCSNKVSPHWKQVPIERPFVNHPRREKSGSNKGFELTNILRKNSLIRPTVMGVKKLGHMMVGRLNKTKKRKRKLKKNPKKKEGEH